MSKYQQPKILLVDMSEDALNALQTLGYNASLARLGHSYMVKQENSFFPLLEDDVFPQDYKENDIVIIDMNYASHGFPAKNIEKKLEVGIDKWWVNHKKGFVNPRPFLSHYLQSDFDRISDTGGVFVVFANALEVTEYYLGHEDYYAQFNAQRGVTYHNWEFLRLLGDSAPYAIKNDHGTIISSSPEISKDCPITSLLSQHLEEATYTCTLSLKSCFGEEWVGLLKNKYGDDVAGVLIPSQERQGLIFILPNLKDKVTFTTKFISEILPDITPSLFPSQKHSNWKKNSKYCLPQVRELQGKISKIREEANSNILHLEQEIERHESIFSYLFDLLTETGDVLVQAVAQTLKVLGFKQVKDVDRELESQGIQRQNREDLQICDDETTLIIEIKGIGGFPSDEDTLAVQKYVVLRMREWQSVHVQGLTIINHQKHLPPLDRNHDSPFRKEMLYASEQQKIGLLTTWDLHRLARSFIQNEWKHHHIKDLFYGVGRVNIVPNHYKFVGTVHRFIEKKGVLGIQVEQLGFTVGSKLAFELEVAFNEQECSSLEFNNGPIEVATVGMLVGIKTNLTKKELHNGIRVYKVIDLETD